jgi:hypothetical protein
MQKNSVDALDEVFDQQVKSRGMWPPQLPDLNPCDFYLCGMLKGKVYVKNLHSLEELQENIRHDILPFPYNSFDVCLETCSHDVSHAWKQSVITSRLL